MPVSSCRPLSGSGLLPGHYCSLFLLCRPDPSSHGCHRGRRAPSLTPEGSVLSVPTRPAWVLVTEVGLDAAVSGAWLPPPRSSPQGPALFPSGPVHPSFGFFLCSSRVNPRHGDLFTVQAGSCCPCVQLVTSGSHTPDPLPGSPRVLTAGCSGCTAHWPCWCRLTFGIAFCHLSETSTSVSTTLQPFGGLGVSSFVTFSHSHGVRMNSMRGAWRLMPHVSWFPQAITLPLSPVHLAPRPVDKYSCQH